jgi:hypothetical protein
MRRFATGAHFKKTGRKCDIGCLHPKPKLTPAAGPCCPSCDGGFRPGPRGLRRRTAILQPKLQRRCTASLEKCDDSQMRSVGLQSGKPDEEQRAQPGQLPALDGEARIRLPKRLWFQVVGFKYAARKIKYRVCVLEPGEKEEVTSPVPVDCQPAM